MAHIEFDLISRYLTGLGTRRDDVVMGVGDDAALLIPPAGRKVAMSMDTLSAGIHFPEDAPPDSVGHKALAVNLSDLAAVGAEPAWAMLALSMPGVDEQWLSAFSRGFAGLARYHNVSLVGGDLCRGPLSMTVHVSGFVPVGRALYRGGARPGDAIFVSGTLGDAALGLQAWRSHGATLTDLDRRQVIDRLHRPTPRVSLGKALRECATAAIDVSDGLAADLSHLLHASGVGGVIDIRRLPLSDAARRLGGHGMPDLALGSGDDYELCFTVPRRRLHTIDAIASRVGVQLTRIGTVEPGGELRVHNAEHLTMPVSEAGYRHFAG